MTYLEKNEKREICLTCLFIDNEYRCALLISKALRRITTGLVLQ